MSSVAAYNDKHLLKQSCIIIVNILSTAECSFLLDFLILLSHFPVLNHVPLLRQCVVVRVCIVLTDEVTRNL